MQILPPGTLPPTIEHAECERIKVEYLVVFINTCIIKVYRCNALFRCTGEVCFGYMRKVLYVLDTWAKCFHFRQKRYSEKRSKKLSNYEQCVNNTKMKSTQRKMFLSCSFRVIICLCIHYNVISQTPYTLTCSAEYFAVREIYSLKKSRPGLLFSSIAVLLT